MPNRKGVGIVGGVGKIPRTSLAGGWNKRGDWKIALKLNGQGGIEKASK